LLVPGAKLRSLELLVPRDPFWWEPPGLSYESYVRLVSLDVAVGDNPCVSVPLHWTRLPIWPWDRAEVRSAEGRGTAPGGSLDRTRLAEDIQLREGVVPHLYVDTAMNVTVGTGHLVPDLAEAQQLGLVSRQAGAESPASAGEVEADWRALQAWIAAQATQELQAGKTPSRRHNHTARHFRSMVKTSLPAERARELFDRDLTDHAELLRVHFPAFDTYPAEAQEGLLDMAFNLGNRIVTRFPEFAKAVRARRWDTAARECRRRGISDGRNGEVAALFRVASRREASDSTAQLPRSSPE
jgi:GH24 family phage-related lysozyme (muramidase)